jgi:hypothetical protein
LRRGYVEEAVNLSDTYLASKFLALAQLIEKEHEAFHYHVYDLVKDMLENSEDYHHVMDSTYQALPKEEIDAFVKAAPPAAGYTPKSPDVQALLKLTGDIQSPHAVPSDILLLVASEVIHRQKWEKIMAENPGTLQALKDRMKS